MKKLLLAIAAVTVLGLATVASAQTTTTTTSSTSTSSSSTSTTVACDALCSTAYTCASSGNGITFRAQQVVQAPTSGCQYSLCGSIGPICIGAPSPIECRTSKDCPLSTQVCVSDSGNPGCGTGFSHCWDKCTN